jgi:toxin ParE1/3/4
LAEVRLSAAADADLTEIWRWSAEHFGPDAATAYLLQIDAALDRLRDFPELGAVRSDLTPPVRLVASGSHRVFYELRGGEVFVLRVLHKSMSAERHLG